MKTRILAIITLLLIVGLTVVYFEDYRTHKLQDYVQHLKQEVTDKANQLARDQIIKNEQAHLKLECQKETQYYNSLTATQKKTVDAPTCSTLQVVE